MATSLLSVKLSGVGLLVFLQLLQNYVCQTPPKSCFLEERELEFNSNFKRYMVLESKRSESQCKKSCLDNSLCCGLIHFTEIKTCILFNKTLVVLGRPPFATTSYLKICQDTNSGAGTTESSETAKAVALVGNIANIKDGKDEEDDEGDEDDEKDGKETGVPTNNETAVSETMPSFGKLAFAQNVPSTSTHPATLWMYVYGGATIFVGIVLMISAYFVVTRLKKQESGLELNEEESPKAVAFNVMMPDFLLPKSQRRSHRKKKKKKKKDSSDDPHSTVVSTIPTELKLAAEVLGGTVQKASSMESWETDSAGDASSAQSEESSASDEESMVDLGTWDSSRGYRRAAY